MYIGVPTTESNNMDETDKSDIFDKPKSPMYGYKLSLSKIFPGFKSR